VEIKQANAFFLRKAVFLPFDPRADELFLIANLGYAETKLAV
jgi:hypothetical protein